MTEENNQQEMSDEEALMKIAQAMKDNAQTPEEKQSVFTFLFNVATAKDTTKSANLRDDKDISELGGPSYTVRGAKEMSAIATHIMGNKYFDDYFKLEAENTLATSLSREGFLIRQGTTQTKQVADITKRRKVNKGWFGKEKVEEQGGDTTTSSGK